MSTRYFAALPPDELAGQMIFKEKDWDNFMSVSRHYERMRRALFFLYGSDEEGFNTYKMGQKGDAGQLAVLKPNHIRAVAKNILALVTSQRPTVKPRASNTDVSTQTQTLLAESQLDYYFREKRFERNIDEAIWMAIGMGAGTISGLWDTDLGETVTVNKATGQQIKNGDIKLRNHMPPDVIIDYTAKSTDLDWWIIRDYENKFELAAKWPDQADLIVQLTRPLEPYRRRFDLFEFRRERDTDIVPVYRLYHNRTPALPSGRIFTCLSDKIWVEDGPLPFKRAPVFTAYADSIWGSPFGYTSIFDGLALQQGIDVLTSVPVSNMKNLGAATIVARKGTNLDVTEVAKGMKYVEFDGDQPPTVMEFAETNPQIFQFRQQLISELGQICGALTDMSRGAGSDAKVPGNLAALRDAQALRFSNSLMEANKRLCEEVGTFIVDCLQAFADAPRVARIAGKSKSYMVKDFNKADLSAIDSVTVETVDPAFATTTGKLQLADTLIQHGDLDAKQYLAVASTGRLDSATEGPEALRLNIKSENERLSQGVQCVVVPTDNHPAHITEHAATLANPEVRENQSIEPIVWAHIEMHMTVWRQTDPGLLAALGIPPPPPGPLGVMPQPGIPGPPGPQAGPPPAIGSPPGAPPPAPLPNGQAGPNLPKPPKNPATGMPWNPATGGLAP